MTHVLTTLGNFETDSIVSVHSEMLGVTYGDDRFDSNSRGLCLAVLILLEMQAGCTVGQLSRRGASFVRLKRHARALRDLASALLTDWPTSPTTGAKGDFYQPDSLHSITS